MNLMDLDPENVRRLQQTKGYIVALKPCGKSWIMLNHISKCCASVWNKTYDVQHAHFETGSKEPLSSGVVKKLHLPAWKEQPGLGALQNVPNQALLTNIDQFCSESFSAFRSRDRSKLPVQLLPSNPHRDFILTRGILLDAEHSKIVLPGFRAIPYTVGVAPREYSGTIKGSFQRLLVTRRFCPRRQNHFWYASVHVSYTQNVGFKLLAAMKKQNAIDWRPIAAFETPRNQWIADAHKTRTQGEI